LYRRAVLVGVAREADLPDLQLDEQLEDGFRVRGNDTSSASDTLSSLSPTSRPSLPFLQLLFLPHSSSLRPAFLLLLL
jgi:hypothetical protein